MQVRTVYADTRLSQVADHPVIGHVSILGSRTVLGSRAAAVIRMRPLLLFGLLPNI